MADPLTPWRAALVGPCPLQGGSCVVSPTFAATLTTHHSQHFETEARRTPHGDEALTVEVPNLSNAALAGLGADGLSQVGRHVVAGDVLIGRTTPRGGLDESPEEKLLYAIFGQAAGAVRDTSVRLPQWMQGTVTRAQRLDGEGDVLARAVVEVSWERPLQVGDVLVDDDGRRVVVAAIREQDVDVAWHHRRGRFSIAKLACALDRMRGRGIGPYDLVTQRPPPASDPSGGQPIRPRLSQLLVQGGAPWTVWELHTLQSDAVSLRVQAFESLVRGQHPQPSGDSQPECVGMLSILLEAAGLTPNLEALPVRLQTRTSEQIRESSHGAVQSTALLDQAGKPVFGGLLCPRIFGPVRDYACSCGKLARMRHRGEICEECGVEVVQSRVRRERMGHLELATPTPHPWWPEQPLHVIPVLPPDLRPLDTPGPLRGFELHYQRILEQRAPADCAAAVHALWDALGRAIQAICRSILTKPTDFSAVASVAADDTLQPGTCRLPEAIALELFRPPLMGLLEHTGHVSTIKSAKRMIRERRPEVQGLLPALAAHWPVYLMSAEAVVACRVTLTEAPCIGLDPHTATALGADQLTVRVPWTRPAVEECRRWIERGVVRASPHPATTEPGWLVRLIRGASPEATLREAVQRAEADPVHDADVAIALGHLPGEVPAAAPWITDALIRALPRPEPPTPHQHTALLARSVLELELSVRSHTVLANAGIQTLGDLCARTEAELLKTRDFGRQSLKEVKEVLADLGLHLGMRL